MGVNGIYGLSGSGIDVESMVKVGMMSRQNEYDKMAQKFTKNEWIKADYLELNNKITTFNSSTLSQYKMSTTMNARSAESSSSAIKVTANSTAGLMNHKVDVAELSSNAYLISTGTLKRYDENGNVDSNSTSIQLKDILFKELEFSSDGKTVTSGTSLPLAGSEYGKNGYTVTSGTSSSNNAFSFLISDNATKVKDENGVETSEFKKVEINFSYAELANGATLNDLASKINAAGLNIRASYDSVQDKFSLYNTKGGNDNAIKIESSGLNSGLNAGINGSTALVFFNDLQLKQSVNGELTSDEFKWTTANTSDAVGSSFEAKGSDGSIWVDGIRYKTTDNKVTVGGITYTALNKTSTETKQADGTYKLDSIANSATVSVTQDTDAIMDKVKSFVSDYNTLLASLYEKYDEKPNSDYKPLTQSQRDQMKDDQIEKWETKAKAGLLYHDQTLGKVIQSMRSAVSEKVDGIEGNYNSIYSLGISTTGIKGQLVLDEDKLKTALANDPDAVYNIFAKLESTTTNSSSAVYKTDSNGRVTSTSNGNGIAQRLGDIFVEANKLIKDRAGSSADITEDSDLNTLLRNLQTKMSNFKRAMNTFEDALYKKYDNMESTLAKLGMQLNYVVGNQS
ncbi:MAG: flagellar filament capping protein FliD [Selenomonadaceae bacterium]|nr:flagellar filament capping protein FliD [Selenomonadaceae bacterium]